MRTRITPAAASGHGEPDPPTVAGRPRLEVAAGEGRALAEPGQPEAAGPAVRARWTAACRVDDLDR